MTVLIMVGFRWAQPNSPYIVGDDKRSSPGSSNLTLAQQERRLAYGNTGTTDVNGAEDVY